jgi:arylamine N-acetyltransferase
MDMVFTVLGWFVLATLALAIARQLSEQKMIADSPFAPAALTERFVDLNPADVEKNPRDPYALLAGTVPVNTVSKTSGMTAQSCYATDFLAQNQKTGNYSQTTNNFKHKGPDSCSSPLTEFVNTIYK